MKLYELGNEQSKSLGQNGLNLAKKQLIEKTRIPDGFQLLFFDWHVGGAASAGLVPQQKERPAQQGLRAL